MAVTEQSIGLNNKIFNVRRIYTNDTTILAGESAEWEIVTPEVCGKITEVSFESLSDKCDVQIAEKAGATVEEVETRIAMSDIEFGYSPSLEVPKSYNNILNEKKLYVKVTNNSETDTATGPQKLDLTFDR
jgi:hypothetical protein